MRKAIKEKILQQKKGSQFYVKMICEGQSSLSREVFGRLFLQYMCAKFLLEPEEITTDNFYEFCRNYRLLFLPVPAIISMKSVRFLQKKRQNVHMENWMQRRLRQNAVVQRLQ